MLGCFYSKKNAVGIDPIGGNSQEPPTAGANASASKVEGMHLEDGSGLLFKETAESTTVSEIFSAAKLGDASKFSDILMKMPTHEEEVALLNTRGMWESTLLMFTIQYGHKALAHNILDRDEIDTHAVNEKGASAFMYACLDNHTDIVMALIKYKGLHRSYKKESKVREKPAKLYNSTIDGTGLWTPLAACVANGNIELFEILVGSGTGGIERVINTVFQYPVLIPVQEDKLAAVNHLNPVMIVCAYGHIELLKKLLEDETYSAHLNLQHTDDTKASILHHAARGKDPEGCMKLLLKQDSLSPTALARTSTKSESGKRLSHSMISQVDELGYMPSHYLVSRNTSYPQVLSMVVEELSDLGALDNTVTGIAAKGQEQAPSLAKHPVGSTMLHIAVSKKKTDYVKVLIDAGVNPIVSSSAPEGSSTPLDLAKKGRSNQNMEMVTMIEEAAESYQKNLTTSGRTDGEMEDLESLEDAQKAIDEEDERRGRLELRQPQRAS